MTAGAPASCVFSAVIDRRYSRTLFLIPRTTGTAADIRNPCSPVYPPDPVEVFHHALSPTARRSLTYLLEDHFVDWIGNDGVAGRAEQQVSAFNTNARIGVERPNGEPGVNRNLERLLQLFRGEAGRGRVLEVIDADRVNSALRAMHGDVVGFAGKARAAECSGWQSGIQIFRLSFETSLCVATAKLTYSFRTETSCRRRIFQSDGSKTEYGPWPLTSAADRRLAMISLIRARASSIDEGIGRL